MPQGELTRLQFRQGNPDIDAKLFISGEVTSLTSADASQQAAQLIQELGRKPDEIRGIAERKERQKKAAQSGRLLEFSQVDYLMRLLEGGEAAPAPTPQRQQPAPAPTQQRGQPQDIFGFRKKTPELVEAGR